MGHRHYLLTWEWSVLSLFGIVFDTGSTGSADRVLLDGGAMTPFRYVYLHSCFLSQ